MRCNECPDHLPKFGIWGSGLCKRADFRLPADMSAESPAPDWCPRKQEGLHIRITLRSRQQTWKEDYFLPAGTSDDNARSWAQDLVVKFNGFRASDALFIGSALYAPSRELVHVEFPGRHEWVQKTDMGKKANGFSVLCIKCGEQAVAMRPQRGLPVTVIGAEPACPGERK